MMPIKVGAAFAEGEFNKNVSEAVTFILYEYFVACDQKAPPRPVFVFGFSRGAMESVLLAQELKSLNQALEERAQGQPLNRKATQWMDYLKSFERPKDAPVTEALLDTLAKYNKKYPLRIKFMGLIDPVNTGTGGGLIGKKNLREIPQQEVLHLFIGLKGGKERYEFSGMGAYFLETAFNAAEWAFLQTYSFEKLPWDTSTIVYPVTHVGAGYDDGLRSDLVKEAEASGAKFNEEK